MPASTSAEEIFDLNPDGIFLSNGPGDPEPLKSAQKVAKKIIKQNLPLFGICLGMQVAIIEYARNVLKRYDISAASQMFNKFFICSNFLG